MSYVFPYGSNLCNNIQSWMRVGDQTPLSNGRDHPSRCDFHIHGTQILSFWHPLGHIDHGLRAWRASWVRPHTHTHTNTHTYQTYTHMPSYSFSKEDAFTLWVSVRQTVAVKEEKKKKKTRTQRSSARSFCSHNLDIPRHTGRATLSRFLPDLTHGNDKAGVGTGGGATEATVSWGSDQAAPLGRRRWQLSTQAVMSSRPSDTGGVQHPCSDWCR